MKGPAFLSQPTIMRLPNLLREILSGEIQIPRFQRPFVWKPEQRLLLMDSIYQGIPIGSLLIWRTREHDLRSYDTLGPYRLPREVVPAVRQYLLDGSQRLTTLYSALAEGLIEETRLSETVTHVPQDTEDSSWPIYFDLETEEFWVKKQDQVAPTWLPLTILFDPFRLYEFQKNLVEQRGDIALANRAESLASTFKDYSIPIVPLVTEDLELVIESFERINSAGTRMDEVHMINALAWSESFDLNERIGSIQEELAEVGWGELDEKVILGTAKALLDLDVFRAGAKKVGEVLKHEPQSLDETTRSLKGAARFLAEHCNIHGPNILPYSFQIVLLADAIYRSHVDFQGGPNTLVEYLRRWFWLTTYSEYFSGISASRLRAAQEHLRKVVSGDAGPRPEDMSSKIRQLFRFDFRAARSRAMALRMAELQARATSGEEYDPFHILAELGKEATPCLIPSRGLPTSKSGDGFENRVICHPTKLGQLRRDLLSRPTELPPEVLESHGVDPEAALALEQQDYERFLRLRRARLLEHERQFVEPLGLAYLVETE